MKWAWFFVSAMQECIAFGLNLYPFVCRIAGKVGLKAAGAYVPAAFLIQKGV